MCSSPCDIAVQPGLYVVGGEDVRPDDFYRSSRPFRLRPEQRITLEVTPHPSQRDRMMGTLIAVVVPVVGLIPLVLPFAVDMPLDHAAGLWVTSGMIIAGGLGTGFGISHRRTKVQLRLRR